MKFIDNNNALVLLGSWNVSIFSADWVKKYIFDNQGDVISEVHLQTLSSRLTFHKGNKTYQIYLSPNRLALTSNKTDVKTLLELQEFIIKIADHLPHTPVTAFGINYVVRVGRKELSIKKSSLPILPTLNKEGTLTNYLITYTIETNKYGKLTLSVSPKRTSYEFNVNYHFNINDFSEVRDILLGQHSVSDFKNKTKTIVENILIGEKND